MKLSRREQVYAVAAALLAILFFADRFAFGPALRKWRELDRGISAEGALLNHNQWVLKDQDRIRQEYRDLVSSSLKDNSHSMTSLLNEVETLAKRTGVKIANIRPESSDTTKGRRIDLMLESSWDSLARFIYQVHQSPQLLIIEKATINNNEKSGNTLRCQVVIGEVDGADSMRFSVVRE